MKRFTERIINEHGSFVMGLCKTCPIVDDRDCDLQCLKAALTLLADYEDTGLTPEEIEKLKCKTDITLTNGKRADYVHYDYDTIEVATENERTR